MGCGRGKSVSHTTPEDCNEVCLKDSTCKQFSVRSFAGNTTIFNCLLWKAECSKYRFASPNEQYYYPMEPKTETVDPFVPYATYL